MNKCGTCKFAEQCHIPDEQREKCKANDTPDPRSEKLIFGHTWEQIQAMQQKKEPPKMKTRKRVKCPYCEVLVINGVVCHEHGCPSQRKKRRRNDGTGR